MRCPNCGSELDEDNYCSECGETITRETKTTEKLMDDLRKGVRRDEQDRIKAVEHPAVAGNQRAIILDPVLPFDGGGRQVSYHGNQAAQFMDLVNKI